MVQSVAQDRLMPALKRIGSVVALCVVIPIAIASAVEGVASIGLTASEMRSTPAPGNFRQAAYDSLVGWVGVHNLSNPDNYGPGIKLATNSEGMRIHRPVTPALAPGVQRAICSGDSFTFGSGVSDDETFCAYLEREIPSFETLNMSQRGYGIDQAYLWYRRDAVRYPHSLHLFAFIWNDFERMGMTSFWGYPKPRLRLKADTLAVENVPVPQWVEPGRWSPAIGQLNNLRLVQLIQRKLDLSETAKLRRVDEQVWDVALAVFRDLEKLNKERGSKLVLVYLPTLPDAKPGPYDNRRNRLVEFSKVTGIPFVDLTPEIRAVPPDSLPWLFITPNALPVSGSSGHYTAMGHEWVAQRLSKHLSALGAVDRAKANE